MPDPSIWYEWIPFDTALPITRVTFSFAEAGYWWLRCNKRKSPRRKMVLPVKVTVDKVMGLAHTVDITPSGARLGALRTQLRPGMVVNLQRGTIRADFRVEWVKQLAPRLASKC